MRIRAPHKPAVMLAIKLTTGFALAAVVLMRGVTYGGCPEGVFCTWSLEFYAMQLDPKSGVAVLLALGLLVSGFKDLLVTVGRVHVAERNVESIADID